MYRVSLGLVVTFLSYALHKESLIIGGQPPLGKDVVVPYSFCF